MILGFNSGFLNDFIQPISKEAISICRKTGCNAIEFSCGRKERIELLNDISKKDLKGFKHISLHAPCLGSYKNNKETKEILNKIQIANRKFNFALVVIHPDDVEDWDVFSNYDFNIAVENMDCDKSLGKDVVSLELIFKKNKNFKMVLDLNHCYTNDRTLKLADELIDNFKDRICEIHISGYQNKSAIHAPLFKTKQIEILNKIPDKNLPIIIESGCKNISDIKNEFEYIKRYIKNDLCAK